MDGLEEVDAVRERLVQGGRRHGHRLRVVADLAFLLQLEVVVVVAAVQLD